MLPKILLIASLLLFSNVFSATCDDPETNVDKDGNVCCRQFQEIYKNGKELCENIYGQAFSYVPTSSPDYSLAYSMWFFSTQNPNDAVTLARTQAGLINSQVYQGLQDTCWLVSEETRHKPNPSPNLSPTFTECAPYKNKACCYESTVQNASVINNQYGPEWKWDRCGKMSPQCERFFVQESCFYECDPNAGLFRRYPPGDPQAGPNNTWEMYHMPIKGDYCDLWYESCKQDMFCGGGDFFECSVDYEKLDNKPVIIPLTAGAIAGISLASIFPFAVCLIFLICRERHGSPVFGSINMDDSKPLKANEVKADRSDPQQEGGVTVI